MPFPKLKVRYNCSFGSCKRERFIDDPETGVCRFVVQDCNVKLPDAENFAIDNQLKAGVTLNQVNTKILGSGVDTQSLTEALEVVKKENSKTNKKSSETKSEVNNED